MPPSQDQATLVGMVENRSARERRSEVRGRIWSVDGRSVKLTKERYINPGCHTLEVEVEYEITGPDDEPCLAFKTFGACDRVATYNSGRQHFALPMRPGLRYELSVQITEAGASVYFVEVHPEQGTLARFTPVRPGTTTCAPGIAL